MIGGLHNKVPNKLTLRIWHYFYSPRHRHFAGEAWLSVDHHGAHMAKPNGTRTAVGKGRIEIFIDVLQNLQDAPILFEGNVKGLGVRPLPSFWIIPPDLNLRFFETFRTLSHISSSQNVGGFLGSLDLKQPGGISPENLAFLFLRQKVKVQSDQIKTLSIRAGPVDIRYIGSP